MVDLSMAMLNNRMVNIDDVVWIEKSKLHCDGCGLWGSHSQIGIVRNV